MTATKTKKPAAKTHKEDPILTISEVAKRIGKHKNTVTRWAHDGVFKLGRHPDFPHIMGIRQSQVDAFLSYFESAQD